MQLTTKRIREWILVPALVILFFSCPACKKKSVNPYFERHIAGTWKFKKVKLYKNFSFGWEDLTSDYESITIVFDSNHSVSWKDQNTGQVQTGSWVLERVLTSSSQVEDCSFLIDINIGNTEFITGTSLNVTRNKIRFSEGKAEGTYNYILERAD